MIFASDTSSLADALAISSLTAVATFPEASITETSAEPPSGDA
jgi:hypothetical protein